jgi:hypothetical protein
MDGLSLNYALEKGPCLMNSLFDVLIGRRQNEVAFVGDVSKMFNQIAVHPDDQKYHRFLWRDGETDREPDVYQWYFLVLEISQLQTLPSMPLMRVLKGGSHSHFRPEILAKSQSQLDFY